MRIFFCALLYLVIFGTGCYSQVNSSRSVVMVRGRVLHHKAAFVEMAVSGLFNSHSESIIIGEDGTFHADLFTDGLQDLYLFHDGAVISLFAISGGTMQLDWDAADPVNSLSVSSPDPDYSRGLQLCLSLSKKFWRPFINLQNRLADANQVPDSSKFSWINELYNEEINTALSDTGHLPSSIYKILNDIYYQFANQLMSRKLMDKYQLITYYPVDSVSQLKKAQPRIKGVFPTSRTLNKEIFPISEIYRSFLFDYIRSKTSSVYSNFKYTLYLDAADNTHFTPLWNEYYTIMANMNTYPVRDWMVARTIMLGFEHYTFEESEAVLRDFLPKCTVKSYYDTLTKYYNSAKKLRHGNMAPDFTLKDAGGKGVSLHELKGKVVYIDFWGLACAPCIRDIKNYVPALHKRYEGKDVVFVNICVCGGRTEPGWLPTIGDLKLEGINLLAPGWPQNQVCEAYNISSIPHYVLIDREGRMVAGNAPGPDMLVSQPVNEIDKLLAR